MLRNAGWTEGNALGGGSGSGDSGSGGGEGSKGGLVVPINMGSSLSTASGAGVGVVSGHVVEQGDDAFDQYRKRMQLAYRFRPNPLNNPRRDYY